MPLKKFEKSVGVLPSECFLKCFFHFLIIFLIDFYMHRRVCLCTEKMKIKTIQCTSSVFFCFTSFPDPHPTFSNTEKN